MHSSLIKVGNWMSQEIIDATLVLRQIAEKHRRHHRLICQQVPIPQHVLAVRHIPTH